MTEKYDWRTNQIIDDKDVDLKNACMLVEYKGILLLKVPEGMLDTHDVVEPNMIQNIHMTGPIMCGTVKYRIEGYYEYRYWKPYFTQEQKRQMYEPGSKAARKK